MEKNCQVSSRRLKRYAAIFPSTFLQLVNDSKNSIWNGNTQSRSSCFFFFFFFLKTLERFSILFNYSYLLNLLFRYLQTCIKESCIYFSSQLFFETTVKTPKLQGSLPLKTKDNSLLSFFRVLSIA